MSFTKRQIITQAFSEIGVAGYVFDLSAEQLQSAAVTLDTMVATWVGRGINLAYPFSASPENSDLDVETGLPLHANEAVILNLATRLANGLGKTVMPSTLVAAKAAFNSLMQLAAVAPQQQLPNTLPAGAGNKTRRDFGDPYVRPPDENPLQTSDNGNLEFLGD